MYAGFILYPIFPALGPIGVMTDLPSLHENAATRIVADHGVALGTFPSLHAGICSTVAIDGWRTRRRWGILFTVIAIAIWASTIYLRYHWFVDLIAGLMLVVGTTLLAERILAHRVRMRSNPTAAVSRLFDPSA